MISDLKYKITALGTAKACVSIGLLTLALWLLDWDGLTNAFQQLDWLITIAALGVLLLEFPVLGFRWVLLVKHELPLTKYEIVRRYFIARHGCTPVLRPEKGWRPRQPPDRPDDLREDCGARFIHHIFSRLFCFRLDFWSIASDIRGLDNLYGCTNSYTCWHSVDVWAQIASSTQLDFL